MIETMNNLKNNRMKTGIAASAITSEHTLRMKKTLKSLNQRTIRASEPLGVGLKDLQNKDKRGKWWLVGASYRIDTGDDDNFQKQPSPVSENDWEEGSDRIGVAGAEGDEDEDPNGKLELRSIVNLARMFGVLVAEDGLSLGVLKVY